MELIVTRTEKTVFSTIGKLLINSEFFCDTLEDVDRGLKKEMSAEQVFKNKVFGKTAIPTGKYEVAISYSEKFKRQMPLIVNVPGFEGIRIHWGNKSVDTDGCLLLGERLGQDFIGHSREMFSKFFNIISETIKTEKVFITIQ